MKSQAVLLATLASFSALATAQEVTVPEGFENTYTGNTGLLWRSTAFRFQCVYDSVHLLNQGLDYPIEITRLRFRPLNGTIDAGGQVYTGVTIALSTGALDSQTMSTGFATNTGLDVTTCYTGNVTLLPVSGATPNDHHIDILLQTPFTYNPNSGPLLVDVTAPTAPSAPVPNCAASNNHLTQFARRISSATPTATTGTLSGFAAAMKIDFNIPAGTALSTSYGDACYDRPRMVYEQFPGGTSPIDLVGTTQTMIYNASGLGGSYIILQGGPGYDGATAAANGVDLLTMTPTSSSSTGTWDDGSIVMTPTSLATGFPFPGVGGGSVTDITINSNAKIYFGATTDATFATNGASYGSILPFQGATGAGLPVLAAFNVDLDPTVGGNIWYEDPSPNGGVRITWDNILNWQDATYTGPAAGPNSVQVELLPSGQIYIAFGAALTNGGSAANDAIVGFSAGGGEPATAMVDWSSLNTFITGDGLEPVTLAVDSRPVVGTTVNLTTAGIPASAAATLSVLSLDDVVPGLDLGFIGMAGCDLNIDFTTAVIDLLIGGSATATRSLVIPNDPTLAGFEVYSQSLVLASGANPFGGLTTNGIGLLLGTQ